MYVTNLLQVSSTIKMENAVTQIDHVSLVYVSRALVNQHALKIKTPKRKLSALAVHKAINAKPKIVFQASVLIIS